MNVASGKRIVTVYVCSKAEHAVAEIESSLAGTSCHSMRYMRIWELRARRVEKERKASARLAAEEAKPAKKAAQPNQSDFLPTILDCIENDALNEGHFRGGGKHR